MYPALLIKVKKSKLPVMGKYHFVIEKMYEKAWAESVDYNN